MSADPTTEFEWLLALPATDRARFLAALSHGLTVAIRVLCRQDAETREVLEAVCQLNEVHHRVAGYLAQIHADNENTSWLLSVVSAVLEPEQPAVRLQARQAWRFARAGYPSTGAA